MPQCFSEKDKESVLRMVQTHTVQMARRHIQYEGKQHVLEVQYWLSDGLYHVVLDTDRPVHGRYAEDYAPDAHWGDLSDLLNHINADFTAI